MESKSTSDDRSSGAKSNSNNIESESKNSFESDDSDSDFEPCTISEPNREACTPFNGRLNLNLVASTKEIFNENDEPITRQEQELLINFELPDGSTISSTFKIGQTVEVLKAYLEEEVAMEMGLQSLYVEDKLLMDPMSLLDYPEFVDAVDGNAEEVFVRVEGEMGEELRK